ncbi:MAG: hypothetical protein FWD25_02455 [Clostridia bacterium]|nr:hypothetical protein [Clostridia bacterium]
MIALCYKCYKAIWEYKGIMEALEMSTGPVFCEGCRQWKPVVITKNDSTEMVVGGLLCGWGKKE